MHRQAAGNAAQPSVPAAAGGFGVHASDETASGVPNAVRAAAAAVPDASSIHLASGMNIAVPNAVVLAAGGARDPLAGRPRPLPFELGADDKTRWEEDARREGKEREEQRLCLVQQVDNVQVQAPESVNVAAGFRIMTHFKYDRA